MSSKPSTSILIIFGFISALDDLKNVFTPNGIDGGYRALRKSIEAIENNKKYEVTTLCEPQMDKRGLYPTISIKDRYEKTKLTMDFFLSLCDGNTTLLKIVESLNLPIWELYELSNKLKNHNLITEVK